MTNYAVCDQQPFRYQGQKYGHSKKCITFAGSFEKDELNLTPIKQSKHERFNIR